MDTMAKLDALSQPLEIELLGEDELQAIEGGSMFQAAAMLCAGGGVACILGVIVGVAVYYVVTH